MRAFMLFGYIAAASLCSLKISGTVRGKRIRMGKGEGRNEPSLQEASA
jgi:hypothetical protein